MQKRAKEKKILKTLIKFKKIVKKKAITNVNFLMMIKAMSLFWNPLFNQTEASSSKQVKVLLS